MSEQRRGQARAAEWVSGRAGDWAREASRTWDPANRMRLSDAERDAVADRLGDHYAAGRLTHDELRARLDAAWDARTRGDLPPIFADLPGGSPLHGQGQVTVPPWMVTAARSAYAARGRPAAVRQPRRTSRPGRVLLGVLLRVALVVAVVALVASVTPVLLLIGVLWLVLARGGCSRRRGAPYQRRGHYAPV